MSKRLFIEVLGGNVAGVYAESPVNIEVVLVDWDNIKADATIDTDDIERKFDEQKRALVEIPVNDIADILDIASLECRKESS